MDRAAKRVHEEHPPAGTASSDNKRARISVATESNSAPASHPREDDVSNIEEPTTFIKAEPISEQTNPVPPTPYPTPAFDGLSQNQKDRIEAFRKLQYHLMTTGVYIISCPFIEDRYPRLKGQLQMSLRVLPQDTEERGLIEGSFNFGLFKGDVIMGVNEDILAIWCYKQQKHRAEEQDAECIRLVKEARAARKVFPKSMETDGKLFLPTNELRFTEPPSYKCEYRCRDDRELFMERGLIFANSGNVNFMDMMGVHMKGDLNLPMLTPDRIEFEGFKVAENLDRSGSRWINLHTFKIRYGSAWNQSD